MSDPLDFPPSRPLPEGVRDRARQHLAEGMAEPRRTSSRTPLVIAAAVVLLAAAGAVVTQGLGGGGGSTAAGPTTVPNTPKVRELPPPDLVDMFHARDGWAPPEAVERCAAAGQGLPAKETWTPLMTTVVHETTLSAFRAGPDSVFFCETTPASVTVSQPWAPDTGGAPARIRFISTQGSVAGFVRPQVGLLRLQPADGLETSAHALIAGDVFLSPQGFRGMETGVTLVVDSERELPATDLPRPSPPTVDRPRPPGDRATESGRRLGACLDTGPVPDAPDWVPGAHAVLGATSEVQLGRYRDLLVVCSVRELGQAPHFGVVDLADVTGRYSSKQALVGKSVWGTGYFYDFRPGPDGSEGSDSRGYVGVVLDDRVASITLTRQGFPDATALVEGGTFVLAGPATKGLATVPEGVDVTVRDAQGVMLEVFSPGG